MVCWSKKAVKENDDMVFYTLLEVVGFLGCNDSFWFSMG